LETLLTAPSPFEDEVEGAGEPAADEEEEEEEEEPELL